MEKKFINITYRTQGPRKFLNILTNLKFCVRAISSFHLKFYLISKILQFILTTNFKEIMHLLLFGTACIYRMYKIKDHFLRTICNQMK